MPAHQDPEWLACRATRRKLRELPDRTWAVPEHHAEPGPGHPLTDAILRILDQPVPDYGVGMLRHQSLVRLGFVIATKEGETVVYTLAEVDPPCPEPVPWHVGEQARIDREVAAEQARMRAEGDAAVAAAKFYAEPEQRRAERAMNEALAASGLLERVAEVEKSVARLEAAAMASAAN